MTAFSQIAHFCILTCQLVRLTPIQEPQPFSSTWFSYKLNHAGLRYEIGLSIHGDFVGKRPIHSVKGADLMIFRDNLKHQLRKDENLVADNICHNPKFARKGLFRGYQGRMVKRILCGHETINSRLKQLNVLKTPFRIAISKHASCF